MPYERSEEKAKKTVLDIYDLEVQIGNLLLQVDEKKASLDKYFDETKTKSLTAETQSSHGTLVKVCAKKQERATVQYDVDKLKKVLDNELFLEITKRTYTIKDIDKMVAMLKAAGVKPSEFKSLINVDIKPQNDKIKFLYDNKEITMDQLKGCFTVKISNSIRINEVKEGKGGSD